MQRRVVVTGVGVVSPLGPDRESTWLALRNGVSGVRRLTFHSGEHEFSVLGAPAMLSAAEPPEPARAAPLLATASDASAQSNSHHVSSGRAKLPLSRGGYRPPFADLTEIAPLGWAGDAGDEPSRQQRLAEQAAREALHDAGLHEPGTRPVAPERIGCCIGSSKGSISSAHQMLEQFHQTGQVDPRLWLGFLPGTLASLLASRWQLLGPTSCPVAACATGTYSIIDAANWIVDGRCDVALAGSADASLDPLLLGSYQRLGVLAPVDQTEPAAAVRPFDKSRRGFAVGEGAGMLILEELEHARNRGAAIYAELAGWATAAAAQSITLLAPTPEALVRCIARARDRAGIRADAIGHVNCHATATLANDPWESLGIEQAFADHASRLRLTANKSMLGHLLGAAGSVELAMALLSLRDQFVPPTINLHAADPACRLDYTPLAGTPATFDVTLKTSIGFGGPIAAVVARLL